MVQLAGRRGRRRRGGPARGRGRDRQVAWSRCRRPYAGPGRDAARRRGRDRRRRQAADHDRRAGLELSRRRRRSAAETYREEERAGSGNVLIGYGTSGAAGRGRTAPATRWPGRPSRCRRPPREAPVEPAAGDLAARPAPRPRGGVDLPRSRPPGPAGSSPGPTCVTRASQSATAAAPPPPPSAPRACPGERRTPLSGFRKAACRGAVAKPRRDPRGDGLGRRRRDRALGSARGRPDARRSRAGAAGLRRAVRRRRAEGVPGAELPARRRARRRSSSPTHINLGIAVQGERGLVVPAVLGAETMTTDAARRGDPRAHRARPRREGDGRGAHRRDVHAEQLRQLPGRRQRRDHQPPAGRDPRLRPHHRPAVGGRRRDRARARSPRCPSSSTTGSATAARRPGFMRVRRRRDRGPRRRDRPPLTRGRGRVRRSRPAARSSRPASARRTSRPARRPGW